MISPARKNNNDNICIFSLFHIDAYTYPHIHIFMYYVYFHVCMYVYTDTILKAANIFAP